VITVTIDPFRFGAASVDEVAASGSYTGNGATNRTIALAFDPKLVVVVCETAAADMWVSNISSGTYGLIIHDASGSAMDNTNAGRPALTTGGFVVSGSAANNTNQTSQVFHYFAFG
jgi:hypothetical protein